jgi:large subunit ribosomal protein L14
VKCIKVLGQGKLKLGSLSDWIVVSVQTAIPILKQKNRINLKKKILKGNIFLGLIVRVKQQKFRKKYSEYINFFDNAVILYRLNKNIVFTRIIGCVAIELRHKKFMKIISLADGIF